jgi:hypothetical protein
MGYSYVWFLFLVLFTLGLYKFKINNALIKLFLYSGMFLTLPGFYVLPVFLGPLRVKTLQICSNTRGDIVELVSKIQVVYDNTPPRLVKNYRRFQESYCFHLKLQTVKMAHLGTFTIQNG